MLPRQLLRGVILLMVAAIIEGQSPDVTVAQPLLPDHKGSLHMVVRLASAQPEHVQKEEDQRISVYRRVSDKATRLDHHSVGLVTARHEDLVFTFGFVSLDLETFEPFDGKWLTGRALALAMLIKNGSSRGIKVDWNEVAIVVGGRPWPILHRGVRPIDRSAPMVPSTIPPSATLEDFVYPKDGLTWTAPSGSGPYRTPGRWQAEQFFTRLRDGVRFELYLPLTRGSERVEYRLTFDVSRPEIK